MRFSGWLRQLNPCMNYIITSSITIYSFEPWEAVVGQLFLTERADAVIDLWDIWCDVLHAGVILIVNTEARVGALQRSVQRVEPACDVLETHTRLTDEG